MNCFTAVTLSGLLLPALAAAQVDCDAFRKSIDRLGKLVAVEAAASAAPTSAGRPRTELEQRVADFQKPGLTIGAAGYLMIAAQSLIDASDAEKGAARAQLHQLKIANYLRVMEMNLNLMIQNRCPLPREPLLSDLGAAAPEPTKEPKPGG
jgi:hypothetical protein